MPLTSSFTGIGVAPTVASAQALSSQVVRVVFSEPMTEDATLLDPASYTITEDPGSNAVAATGVVADTPSSVMLALDGPMTEGQDNYNVAVSTSVVDLAGNALDAAGDDVDFDGRASNLPVSDWCTRGTDWLLAQFADQPKLLDLICVFLDEIQELEQALGDLRDLRSLDNANAAQLDEIGVRLGYARVPKTLADADYRRYLRAVARARVASGSADDMIDVALEAGGLTAGDITHLEDYPAGVLHTAEVALAYDVGARVAEITRIAKPAGVRFALDYSPSGVNVVTFADEPVLPLTPWGDEGMPSIGGPLSERDSGR